MSTWQHGSRVITRRRIEAEGPLLHFVEELRKNPRSRVPGTAVFPHSSKQTTPLALRANTQFNQILHEHVLIVSVQAQNVPHVPPRAQSTVDELGYADVGIVHLTIRVGFQDEQDIPALLRHAVGLTPEPDIDPDQAFYFLSHITIQRGIEQGMATWRKRLFIGLSHNAASPAAYFRLPEHQTVIMGSRIDL